jgi:hypothetical protein
LARRRTNKPSDRFLVLLWSVTSGFAYRFISIIIHLPVA